MKNLKRAAISDYVTSPLYVPVYISSMVACAAWRFGWERKLIKAGEGEETARKLVRVLFPTKTPCYAGYMIGIVDGIIS